MKIAYWGTVACRGEADQTLAVIDMTALEIRCSGKYATQLTGNRIPRLMRFRG